MSISMRARIDLCREAHGLNYDTRFLNMLCDNGRLGSDTARCRDNRQCKIFPENEVISLNEYAQPTQGKQLDLKETLFPMALIDFEDFSLRLRGYLGTGENAVSPKAKLTVAGVRDFVSNGRRGERVQKFLEFLELALCCMKRRYAPKVQNVDTILPLSFAAVTKQPGAIPINPENTDTKIFEVIFVCQNRKQQWDRDILHGNLPETFIISCAYPIKPSV